MHQLRDVARITAALLLLGTAGAQSSWQAGVAKVRITPEQPMWMAGYAGRPRPASEKIHDLWAKALVLEDARVFLPRFWRSLFEAEVPDSAA